MDLNELREELVLLGRLRLRLNRRVDHSTAPPSQVNEEQSRRQDRFRQLGIYTPEMLEAGLKTDATAPFLVEGLLQMNSLNLLVGDSGLGKTPLAIQMGICIAAGIDFLGRKVEKGPVLYCDAESRKSDFAETLRTD